jgi:hypothetical protein
MLQLAVRRALPDGLARDADIFEVLSVLGPLRLRNDKFQVRCSLTWPRTRWSGAGASRVVTRRWRYSRGETTIGSGVSGLGLKITI